MEIIHSTEQEKSAKNVTTLIYALKARGLKKGIATLCLGGGNGVALAIETV